MDSAWDRLLDLVDHLAADPARSLDAEVEQTFATLCAEAMQVRDIDGELHVPDVARWLVGLLHGHRALRDTRPQVDADRDLADLRLIATRWLHPPRPR